MTIENGMAHSSAADAAEEGLDGLKQGARRAVRQVADKAGHVADSARATYHRTVEGVKSVAGNPSKITEALREAVRDNPLAVIAGVTVVAFALGSLFRRSRQ